MPNFPKYIEKSTDVTDKTIEKLKQWLALDTLPREFIHQTCAFNQYDEANWAHYLAHHNKTELLALAIAKGIDFNAYAIRAGEEHNQSRITPFMVALQAGAEQSAQLLLENNASLSGYVKNGYTPLYLAARCTSRVFVEYFLEYAKLHELNEDLINQFYVHDGEKYDTPNAPEHIADTLLNDMLSGKIQYFKVSDFLYIANDIKPYFNRHFKEPQLRNSRVYDSIEQETTGHAPDKKTAIKNALIVLYETLQAPDLCYRFLEPLENEIKKLSKGELPSKKISRAYTEEVHMGYRYPVPTVNFVPEKLDSLLKRAILNILRQSGLAQEVVSLVGLLPEEIISKIIVNGDYFSEKTQDFKSLLHGKIPHMIHYVLVCIMVQTKYIKVGYGDHQEITPLDILRALFTEKPDFVCLQRNDASSYWEQIFDAPYPTRYTFNDPYRLNSALMIEAANYNLPELSSCIINSHCKFMKRSSLYYTAVLHEEVSVATLWNYMISLSHITLFLHCELSYFLKMHRKEEIKYPQEIQSETKYLVIAKYGYKKPEAVSKESHIHEKKHCCYSIAQ